MTKKADLILSLMTLFGLIFIFGGIVLSSITPIGTVILIIGLILMFTQSVITLCTWKQNRLSENIAAIGFVAGVPIALVFIILGIIAR